MPFDENLASRTMEAEHDILTIVKKYGKKF